MKPSNPQELINFLSRYQFLDFPQLEMLERDRDLFPTVDQLLTELVSRGWITQFQAQWIDEGNADKLKVGPYRLQEPLGEGGMGVVYKAWHPRLDRTVAIKLIRPQVLASKPELIHRFQREARAIAQLLHPNVVLLYDADEDNGTHFLAMEYVEGVTLEKMVRMTGPLPIKQAADYVRQTANGLQHAFECGLVHRDIKPSNLLVSQKLNNASGYYKRSSGMLRRPALITPKDKQLAKQMGTTVENRPTNGAWGVAKILDMGLARLQESLEPTDVNATPLTRAGCLLGTPDFISPEQARDARKVDIRADIYSLGCTFYFLLTGRPPFPGGTEVQKLLRHQSDWPTPVEELRPQVPTAICKILMKTLQKRPDDRYSNPQELADELHAFLNPPVVKSGSSNNGTSAHTNNGQSQVAASQSASRLPGTVVVSKMPMLAEAKEANPNQRTTAEAEIVGFTAPEATTKPKPVVKSRSTPDRPPAKPVATAKTIVGDAASVASSGSTHSILAHNGLVSALIFSPDSTQLVSAGIDGKIIMWDVTGEKPRELRQTTFQGAEINSLTFAPHEPYMVVGSIQQGHARIMRWDWHEDTSAEWGMFATTEQRGVTTATFCSEGKMFVAGVGPFLVSWKVSGRDASARTILKGHNHLVRAIAISPERKLLASGGDGKAFRLWTSGWLGMAVKVRVPAHEDALNAMLFTSDGKQLLTASQDGVVKIWDPNAPTNAITQWKAHIKPIKLMQFLAGGKHLVTVSEGTTVSFWDVATQNRLFEKTIETSSVTSSYAISPNGKYLAVGRWDGKINVFSLESQTMEATASMVKQMTVLHS